MQATIPCPVGAIVLADDVAGMAARETMAKGHKIAPRSIAAGANLLAFTTGRGSTFGSKPTPCLKITSNADLARRMADDIDVDCSPILDGLPVEEAGGAIFDRLIDMACGTPTKSETLGIGDHEFVPWQLGAWM